MKYAEYIELRKKEIEEGDKFYLSNSNMKFYKRAKKLFGDKTLEEVKAEAQKNEEYFSIPENCLETEKAIKCFVRFFDDYGNTRSSNSIFIAKSQIKNNQAPAWIINSALKNQDIFIAKSSIVSLEANYTQAQIRSKYLTK